MASLRRAERPSLVHHVIYVTPRRYRDVIMKNHALANAATADGAGFAGAEDVFGAALANLAAAGIVFAEVAGCSDHRCPLCTTRDLPHAA